MPRTFHSSDVESPPSSSQAGWERPWLVCLGILVMVAAWVVLSAHTHTALHHDMAEQFVWGHAWQLGYPKHPPLPTWLFMLAQTVMPAKPATLYGLSALCIGLTGVFTYLAARELMPSTLALCVAGLWGLQQPFGWRAWIYNHNTVLVMTVAMVVYFASRAARSKEQLSWAAAGVAAGLALSTKLQAVVPLIGVLWALWRSGVLESLAARKGVALAIMLSAAVCAPPLWWMATGHTNALTYATHQLGSGDGDSVRMGQFVVSELRMLAPALVVLLIWVLGGQGKTRKGGGLPDHVTQPDRRSTQAWIEGLLFVPLAFVLAMGIFAGSKLHAQWGVQTFQFASLALVVWFGGYFDEAPVRRLGLSVGVVQLLSFALAASPVGAKLHAPGAVQGYPARELADRVEADWQRAAPTCVLRYLDAPFFEGGQLAAFGRGFPVVLQDGRHRDSPWVNEADMQLKGSVVLRYLAQDLPPDVMHTPDMVLIPPARVKGVVPVVWGIRLPKGECEPERGVK